LEVRSPIDSEIVVGTFARGTRADAQDAIAAARRAQLAWFRLGWEKRLEILRRAAELISERQMEYAGLMAIEVGKTRLEALGEVEEAADLIRYYAKTAEDNAFYDHPMDNLGDAAVHTRSILRPHGVFAVISPFNFPMALSGGPSSGALVTGNAVVLKPSNQGALLGYELSKAYRDAGIPAGAFQFVPGRGAVAGEAIWRHPDVGGITFTGSYPVGMSIYKGFATEFPKPVICEMGGKNPTIVTKNADIDKATDGVLRSAFGFARGFATHPAGPGDAGAGNAWWAAWALPAGRAMATRKAASDAATTTRAASLNSGACPLKIGLNASAVPSRALRMPPASATQMPPPRKNMRL